MWITGEEKCYIVRSRRSGKGIEGGRTKEKIHHVSNTYIYIPFYYNELYKDTLITKVSERKTFNYSKDSVIFLFEKRFWSSLVIFRSNIKLNPVLRCFYI